MKCRAGCPSRRRRNRVPGAGLTAEHEESAIKGPGHRAKFDVRRVWECPACGRRVRTGGHIVNLRCDCRAAGGAGPAVWMKLVEGPPQPPRRE
jgi:hypothetical protein